MARLTTAAHRAAERRRHARWLARLALAVTVAIAVLAPIAWERLPNFQPVFIDNGKPPGPPGPGIDPAGGPRAGLLIRPRAQPSPTARDRYKYMSLFGGHVPRISSCSL